MNKWYKTTGALLLGICAMTQVNAQTHFGMSVGTQGARHAFFGTQAGEKNSANAYDNGFFGYLSGSSNITGVNNVFVGAFAGNGSNTTGNVFVGSKCGQHTFWGDYNTFMGTDCGQVNIGSGNLFAGYKTGFTNLTGTHNTYLGTEAAVGSGSGNENVFVGYSTGPKNALGNYNLFLGSYSGKTNTTGNSNTYVGYLTDGLEDLQNATAIGAHAKVTANNSLVLGYKAKVGIGVSAPSFQLHLSTDAAAKAGSPDWTVASDSRLKRNITEFTDGLDLLKQIRPVWFQYNGQAGIETGDKKFVGIVAQEMQKIAPYTIGTFTHQDSLGNKTEYLDYDANAVTYILINSVKEQQRVIEAKDAELKEVNAQVSELSKRLEQLERIVASNTAKPLTGNAARIEPNANGVIVEQNVPNGFSESSAIRYFVPNSVKDARMDVYSVSGVKVNSYPVKGRGEGQLTISADDFPNGVFLYDLVTDGKSNGVKKMVIQK